LLPRPSIRANLRTPGCFSTPYQGAGTTRAVQARGTPASMSSSNQHTVLLAEYTLGLLNASETAQAHALLGSDPDAVAMALAWEQSLLELTDLLAPVDPSP